MSTKGKAAASTAAALCAKETQSASQRQVTAHLFSHIYFVYPVFFYRFQHRNVRACHDFYLILLPNITNTLKCI